MNSFFVLFCYAHGVFPNLIALRLDLAAQTQRVVVFFFTSKTLVNIHSYFQALCLLTGDDVLGDIGILSVNPSVVETISASRISLNCC